MATFQGLAHSRDEILNMNHHSRKLLFVQWWAIRCYSSFHGRSVFVTLSCSGSVACSYGGNWTPTLSGRGSAKGRSCIDISGFYQKGKCQGAAESVTLSVVVRPTWPPFRFHGNGCRRFESLRSSFDPTPLASLSLLLQ